MADGCRYEAQLEEACRLVAEGGGAATIWQLVYQSRSGPPHAALARARRAAMLCAKGNRDRTARRRRGHRADRLHLRPHGSGLRPRHRGASSCATSWASHGPRRHGRHPSALRADDPRAGRRAADGTPSGWPSARSARSTTSVRTTAASTRPRRPATSLVCGGPPATDELRFRRFGRPSSGSAPAA